MTVALALAVVDVVSVAEGDVVTLGDTELVVVTDGVADNPSDEHAASFIKMHPKVTPN